MKLNEIAYNIKNLVEGGITGEDSNLAIEQIFHMVDYHRAQLLVKYTSGGKDVSNAMLQTKSNSLSQGTISLPTPVLGFPNNKAFKSVVVIKNTTPVAEQKKHNVVLINDNDREFFQASRFAPNQNQLFATHSPGNDIRIFTNDGQLFEDSSYIGYVTAVFGRPLQIEGYTSTTDNYPIPAELVGSLVEAVLAKEFNMYLRASADYINDSVDDKDASPPTASIPPQQRQA